MDKAKGGELMRRFILVINPGSTSTKVALFEGITNLKQKNLIHFANDLLKYNKISEQYEYRENTVLSWLKEEGIETSELVAVVGRGGLLKPVPSGVYEVTDAMIEDLKVGIQGEHASNLGGIIAKSIADNEGIDAYIVDPVAVDEFEEIARISGHPELPRRSLVHALNIRAVARRIAKSIGKNLDEMNFIVAHIGGGISVAALKLGRIVDVNNANEGGPFSPERAGGVPVGDLINLAFSGKYTYGELKKKLVGQGGLVGYLGTNDIREVAAMIENGDEKAKLIMQSMAYQIAKEIGACAAVLSGRVDRIILTGGLAYSKMITDLIKNRVYFIAPIEIIPGEDEMQALAEGAFRVVNGEEKAKIYEEEV